MRSPGQSLVRLTGCVGIVHPRGGRTAAERFRLRRAAFSQPLFASAVCNCEIVSGLQSLAINADGTQNSCTNPAASGSVVTVFLNGLGVSSPSYPTGMVITSGVTINPAASLNPPFGSYMEELESSTTFLSTATLLGSIDGIAQVQIKVSRTSSPLLPNYPALSAVLNFPKCNCSPILHFQFGGRPGSFDLGPNSKL